MPSHKDAPTLNDLSQWRDYLSQLPPYGPIEPLDPQERMALVVVDTQYCSSGRHSMTGVFFKDHFPHSYEAYFDRIEQVMIPAIRRLISHFREHARQIIYLTVSSHLPNGLDFEPLRRLREQQFESEFGQKSVLTQRDSRDAQILDELAPQPGDLILNKVSASAFTSSGFDQILRNMGITSLVFTGVVTNGCVFMTALDARDRGYKVVMVEDACAAISDVLHYTPLMMFHHGAGRVLSATDVIAELEAGGTRKPQRVASLTGSGP
jgi:nicotinamidase-related amidase